MATSPDAKVFFIGDWRVSPGEGLLTRDGEVVHLEPKVADVLVYLASRPNEVVTRDELERAVWHGALVGYDAVTAAVIKLRRALRDDARHPRYISTIPKRGYELIAPVTFPGEGEAVPSPTAGTGDLREGSVRAWSRWPRPARLWATFALAAVIVVGAVWLWMLAPYMATGEKPQPGARPAIIVLPFKNLGGDPRQDYLADGMTEDIITDLSRTSRLRVLANSTSSTYRGEDISPETLGRTLNVDFVLRGNVRSVGDAIRVNAQLVDAKTGFNKWGETYDRKTDQVFAVQHEITGGVVEALAVTLTAPEKQRLARRATSNLKAYDFFQEGQRLSKVRTKEANQQAQEAYRKAIEIDPTYGRAYGALAVTLGVEFLRGWTDNPIETLDHALALAKNAVALDHTIPQTYWALGYVYLMRKEYGKAEQAVARAVDIAPNYADGYGLLALISNNRGKAEQAVVLVRKGMELNPFYSWDYPYNLGRAYYTMGRYVEAITALEDARDRNPSAIFPKVFLMASYVRVGRQEDAEWVGQELAAMSPPVTLAHVERTFPIEDRQLLTTLLDDLRKAGLPEE